MKLLDKSNCRECGEPTCMAFAACVHKGDKDLDSCPRLEPEVLEKFGGGVQKRRSPDQDAVEAMAQLKNEVARIDLAAAARRVGGRFLPAD